MADSLKYWCKYSSTLFIVLFSFCASADNAVNLAVLDLATSWIKQQQNPDGSWGTDQNLRYTTTTRTVSALEAANQYSSEYYAGLAWIENHSSANADDLSRKIGALYARGNNLSEDLSNLQASKQTITQVGWGLSDHYTSSPLDTAIVLAALINF